MCALKPPFQGNDMNTLYKKVIKGQFSRIPKQFSSDLEKFIRSMLVVNQKERPDINQIIKNPIYIKKNQEFFPDSQDFLPPNLLPPLKYNKNVKEFNNKFPPATYEKLRRKRSVRKIT